MIGNLRIPLIVAGVAAAAMFSSADKAHAGWGHARSTTYYHAPFAGAGYGYGYTSTLGSRYSLYGHNYGYSSYYNPPFAGYGPEVGYGPAIGYGMPGYGAAPLGGSFGRPRGKLEYDVYTPYGKQEVEYKFRRNGRIDVDYDD